LSADGSIGVAGSWGQLSATYGDVLTVFERSSSTPVFQLLDDIDEPGSIFSVDISTDGSLVSAGGKAVHAREFGNGGEVYAINTELGIVEHGSEVPVQFTMSAPMPNPCTADLTLRFSVPRTGRLSLRIYDITGCLVATLVDENFGAGTHEICWNRTGNGQRKVNSGIYFLRADYGKESITRKVIVSAE
jgi:hypothetical protein